SRHQRGSPNLKHFLLQGLLGNSARRYGPPACNLSRPLLGSCEALHTEANFLIRFSPTHRPSGKATLDVLSGTETIGTRNTRFLSPKQQSESDRGRCRQQ